MRIDETADLVYDAKSPSTKFISQLIVVHLKGGSSLRFPFDGHKLLMRVEIHVLATVRYEVLLLLSENSRYKSSFFVRKAQPSRHTANLSSGRPVIRPANPSPSAEEKRVSSCHRGSYISARDYKLPVSYRHRFGQQKRCAPEDFEQNSSRIVSMSTLREKQYQNSEFLQLAFGKHCPLLGDVYCCRGA